MIHRLRFRRSNEARAFRQIVFLREWIFGRAAVFASERLQRADGDAARLWAKGRGKEDRLRAKRRLVVVSCLSNRGLQMDWLGVT